MKLIIVKKITDEGGGQITAERHSYQKMGDVSDGYHTFNELYRHRYVLFVALMRTAYGSLFGKMSFVHVTCPEASK